MKHVDPDVKVGIGVGKPTHHLSLSNGREKRGFLHYKDLESILHGTRTPSTILIKGGRGDQWGSHDPDYAHIQQSTWVGGMMQEEFGGGDPTQYFFGTCFSMVPGRLIPRFRYLFADGEYRDYNENPVDGNFEWWPVGDSLLGEYFSEQFTVDAVDDTSYDADVVYLWIRKIGTPGNLIIEIWTDDGSDDPDAVIAGATVTIDAGDVDDFLGVWYPFNLGTDPTLSHSTKYHVVGRSAGGDPENHWEIGVDPDGSTMQYGFSGNKWGNQERSLYYRVVDDDTAIKWHYFYLQSDEWFKISQPPSGNSEIYHWDETNDEWDKITSFTGDAISGIIESVTVSNGLAHCARGTAGGSETIWTFYHDSGTYYGQDDTTAANTADLLCAGRDATDGPQIWRACNDDWTVSRSDVKDFNTDLAFGDDIQMPEGFDIIDMRYYNNQLYVRTIDGLWAIKNDVPQRLGVGFDAVFELEEHVPLLDKDLFLFVAWDYTLERIYGSTVDDVGPWRNSGLPEDYQGRVSALCSGVGMLFVAVDGGDNNYSSVLAYDGMNYHPIFMGPEKGQRIRNIAWQPVSGAAGRLWVSYGNDSIYITFPYQTLNPLHDSTMNYHFQDYIETSTFTMRAERLKKFFNSLELVTERLGNSASIDVYYKLDQDIGDSDQPWIPVTSIMLSPFDSAPLKLGNRHRIRFRLVLNTHDSDKPATILSYVLECFARTPVKQIWELRVKVGGKTLYNQDDHAPIDLYNWLLDQCRNAEVLHMRAMDFLMDDKWVIIEPPSLQRTGINLIRRWFTGWATFTLKEA